MAQTPTQMPPQDAPRDAPADAPADAGQALVMMVAPYLVVEDADKAIAFYARAFGARARARIPNEGGKGVMHAEIEVGRSIIMLTDENAERGTTSPKTLGGTAVSLMLATPDCDKLVETARQAGCTVHHAPEDMFWGARFALLEDPFGHIWAINQPLTPAKAKPKGAAVVAPDEFEPEEDPEEI